MNRFRRLLAVVALASLPTLSMAGPYTGLYVFGDSLSDGATSRWRSGPTHRRSSAATLHPERPYASGQFSNGDVWVKPFAKASASTAMPSLAGGTDFAFGGARIATDRAGLAAEPARRRRVPRAVGGVAPSSAST